MNQVISSVIKWYFWLSLGSFSTAIGANQLDPTDDFSFSLQSGPAPQSYSLISERRISEILSDRLDCFPKSQTLVLARHIIELCHQHRLDPSFILSLMEIESSFRVKAVSPVGALGLMQVMPSTAQFVVNRVGVRFPGHEDFKPKDIYKEKITAKTLVNPFLNTLIGIAYLAWLRDHYRGTPYHVLAAYNVGPTRLDELISRKNFRPVETKRYFLAIRRNVPHLRFYKKNRLGSVL